MSAMAVYESDSAEERATKLARHLLQWADQSEEQTQRAAARFRQFIDAGNFASFIVEVLDANEAVLKNTSDESEWYCPRDQHAWCAAHA
jgi:glutamine synthetase adenylyltransferase